MIVINPLRARRFAEAMGHLEKTDRVDARVLTVFGQAFPAFVAVTPRTAFLNRPADLLTVCAHCVAMRASLDRTAYAVAEGCAIEKTRVVAAALDSEVEGVDTDIKTLIMDNEDSAESWRILLSVPGIGVVNTAAMIC